MVFHHIGIACRDIDREQRAWTPVGYVSEGDAFADPAQGVRGRFLIGPGPRLELLEPLAGDTTLAPWLGAGSRMYHHAYEVPDLDAAVAGMCDEGARVAREPLPAVAFGGRHVCFLALRSMILVELIGST